MAALNDGDSASPETCPGHPGPHNTRKLPPFVNQGVKLRTGHLVIGAQRIMRLVHQPAKQFYIIVFKCLYCIQGPAVLGDYMLRPLTHHGIRYVTVKHPQISNSQLTEILYKTVFRDELHSLLALRTPFIVLAVSQTPALVGICDHQPPVAQVERCVPVFKRVAVKVDSMVLPAEPYGKLIHDAAVHPHKPVLGFLRHPDHLHHLQPRSRHLIQRHGRDHLY